ELPAQVGGRTSPRDPPGCERDPRRRLDHPERGSPDQRARPDGGGAPPVEERGGRGEGILAGPRDHGPRRHAPPRRVRVRRPRPPPRGPAGAPDPLLPQEGRQPGAVRGPYGTSPR